MEQKKPPQKNWTADDWAQEGYVLITVRESGGLTDDIYIKRRFTSPVITQHEKTELISRAKHAHKQHTKQRRIDMNRHTNNNHLAMRPYIAQKQKVMDERRAQAMRDGAIPFDQMTFFDLLDMN